MASNRIINERRQIAETKIPKLLARAQAEAGVGFRKPTAHPRNNPALRGLEDLEALVAVVPQLLDRLKEYRGGPGNQPAATAPKTQRKLAS